MLSFTQDMKETPNTSTVALTSSFLHSPEAKQIESKETHYDFFQSLATAMAQLKEIDPAKKFSTQDYKQMIIAGSVQPPAEDIEKLYVDNFLLMQNLALSKLIQIANVESHDNGFASVYPGSIFDNENTILILINKSSWVDTFINSLNKNNPDFAAKKVTDKIQTLRATLVLDKNKIITDDPDFNAAYYYWNIKHSEIPSFLFIVKDLIQLNAAPLQASVIPYVRAHLPFPHKITEAKLEAILQEDKKNPAEYIHLFDKSLTPYLLPEYLIALLKENSHKWSVIKLFFQNHGHIVTHLITTYLNFSNINIDTINNLNAPLFHVFRELGNSDCYYTVNFNPGWPSATIELVQSYFHNIYPNSTKTYDEKNQLEIENRALMHPGFLADLTDLANKPAIALKYKKIRADHKILPIIDMLIVKLTSELISHTSAKALEHSLKQLKKAIYTLNKNNIIKTKKWVNKIKFQVHEIMYKIKVSKQLTLTEFLPNNRYFKTAQDLTREFASLILALDNLDSLIKDFLNSQMTQKIHANHPKKLTIESDVKIDFIDSLQFVSLNHSVEASHCVNIIDNKTGKIINKLESKPLISGTTDVDPENETFELKNGDTIIKNDFSNLQKIQRTNHNYDLAEINRMGDYHSTFFSPHSPYKLVAIGSTNENRNYLSLYEKSTNKLVDSIDIFETLPDNFVYIKNTNRLLVNFRMKIIKISISDDNKMTIRNEVIIPTPQPTPLHGIKLTDIIVSQAGKHALVKNNIDTLYFVDLEKMTITNTVTSNQDEQGNHNHPPVLMGDGIHVMLYYSAGTVEIWNLETANLVTTLFSERNLEQVYAVNTFYLMCVSTDILTDQRFITMIPQLQFDFMHDFLNDNKPQMTLIKAYLPPVAARLVYGYSFFNKAANEKLAHDSKELDQAGCCTIM